MADEKTSPLERYKKGWRWMDIAILVAVAATIYFEPLYLFVTIPGLIILYRLLPNREKRALWYSQKLPTSKISSVAIGLAELKGQVHMITPKAAPRSTQRCIGYLYIVEKESESTDSDGKRTSSWTETHRETVCADFNLTDDTGTILVKASDIDFIKIPVTNVITQSGIRFNEYLLLDQAHVLMIGYASAEDNHKVLIKDTHNDVFSVSDIDEINAWEIYNPLINRFLIMIFFVFAIIVYILTH